jgi:acetyl esterase
MTLHPMLQAIVDQTADAPPMNSLTPERLRSVYEAQAALAERPAVAKVEDRMIPGPRGEIRVRIYRPDLQGGHPVITYFHGSGFVICSIDTHDVLARHLCLRANAVVVSVDYALAPENKFPAGPDDCLAATQWVSENASNFGGDPSRHAVAGDSAGATMATVTAMRLRDAGAPALTAQLLFYPVTDYPDPGPHSYVERAEGYGLTADAMRWFWGHYLDDISDAAHPHASPLQASDLANLPPAYVMTAEYDVLRDEGEDYAARLKTAGVETELIRYGDMNHGFISLVGIVDRSDEALSAACDWLATRL